MPFETLEGELKVLVYRGGYRAKIRARCAKGSQISVLANACGGGVVYSGHYIMTIFRVANSAQYPGKLQYNFMVVPTPCPTIKTIESGTIISRFHVQLFLIWGCALCSQYAKNIRAHLSLCHAHTGALSHSPSAIRATLQCRGVVNPVLVLSRLMDSLCSPADW